MASEPGRPCRKLQRRARMLRADGLWSPAELRVVVVVVVGVLPVPYDGSVCEHLS